MRAFDRNHGLRAIELYAFHLVCHCLSERVAEALLLVRPVLVLRAEGPVRAGNPMRLRLPTVESCRRTFIGCLMPVVTLMPRSPVPCCSISPIRSRQSLKSAACSSPAAYSVLPMGHHR